MPNQERAAQAAEKIIEEIDGRTLLGAAFDCMSDAAKARFQKKLESIITEAQNG